MRGDGDFVTHCIELLSPLGAVRARRMFGGHGLYVDERFVAIISGQRLYLKTDEMTRGTFVAARCTPFEYRARDDKRQVMSYWTAPDEAMDSPAAMLPWARLALAAALRAAIATAPRRPRARIAATVRTP
jgi:DNA transformation protein